MLIDFVYLEKNLQDHIVKQFNSKKNSVYLLEHDSQKIVAKVFKTSRHRFEFEILQNLYKKNIPVPKPYSLVNQTIFMEYIQGETLMDIINSNLANKEKFL
ncbi:MAG: phosphotransferase, partial [Candidatus Methanofastidiosum sp.]|nr:phosphotransferase [Methanofastidiosum sp.]